MPIYKVKGKMVKHLLLLKRPELHPHLPETHWLTASTGMRMLSKSGSVYIKPDRGSGGSGIIKIRKLDNDYAIQNGPHRRQVDDVHLFKVLKDYERSGKRYIVQKGIQLARYQGRIFDVRVYLQKPKKKWMVSGMAARVAAANRYVTNRHQGGHAEPLRKVLAHLFPGNKLKVDRCFNQLNRTTLIVADTLDKRFTDIRELGIDFGIEKNGRVWFIEANTRPKHQLFAQLPDKTMLTRIRRNKRLMAVGDE